MLRFYFWFAKLFIFPKQPYLRLLSSGQLFTNWYFQHVLKINSDVPFMVHYTSRFTGCKNLKINGDPEKILISFASSGGCYYAISANATLEIGEGTIWSHNLNIQTSNHDLNDLNKAVEKSIKIGKGCWIGGNVSILAGVELGDQVIVGANAVVTKSFQDRVVIAGSPAKIIRIL